MLPSPRIPTRAILVVRTRRKNPPLSPKGKGGERAGVRGRASARYQESFRRLPAAGPSPSRFAGHHPYPSPSRFAGHHPYPSPSRFAGHHPYPSPSRFAGLFPDPSPSRFAGLFPDPSPSRFAGLFPDPSPSRFAGLFPDPSPSRFAGLFPDPSPSRFAGLFPDPSPSRFAGPSLSPQGKKWGEGSKCQTRTTRSFRYRPPLHSRAHERAENSAGMPWDRQGSSRYKPVIFNDFNRLAEPGPNLDKP